jgi:hypothetical protein
LSEIQKDILLSPPVVAIAKALVHIGNAGPQKSQRNAEFSSYLKNFMFRDLPQHSRLHDEMSNFFANLLITDEVILTVKAIKDKRNRSDGPRPPEVLEEFSSSTVNQFRADALKLFTGTDARLVVASPLIMALSEQVSLVSRVKASLERNPHVRVLLDKLGPDDFANALLSEWLSSSKSPAEQTFMDFFAESEITRLTSRLFNDVISVEEATSAAATTLKPSKPSSFLATKVAALLTDEHLAEARVLDDRLKSIWTEFAPARAVLMKIANNLGSSTLSIVMFPDRFMKALQPHTEQCAVFVEKIQLLADDWAILDQRCQDAEAFFRGKEQILRAWLSENVCTS